MLLVIIIIVPAAFILNSLISEATTLYNVNLKEAQQVLVTRLNLEVNPLLAESLDDLIQKSILYVIDETSAFFLSLPQMFLNFFMMIFIFFFVFRDGEQVMRKLEKTLPIDKRHKDKILKKVKTTTSSLVYGEIAISLLEGIIAAVGFYLIGVGSPIFLGIIVAIFALLPLIGPAAVYSPITLYYILVGNYTSATIVFLFGFVVLSILLDLIVKPKLLGIKGHIHPIITLLGVLGGLTVFGLPGLIIGPVILVLFVLILETYLGIGNETQS
tara:strand:- start:1158 stop:1970 length:813 start_codon:yes stop_codon:yes gene_type:complete